jgi:two-component system, cell cycle sensor histidine kinase and response regulator CckA
MGNGSPCILVVDDDHLVRRLVCAVLGQSGFAVLEASSGAEALDLFEQRHASIDLVLTDLVMPGMSGTELARHIASVDAAPPIVFMSAYCDTLDRAGGLGCISKPFANRDLIAKVRQKLEGTTRRQLPQRAPAQG